MSSTGQRVLVRGRVALTEYQALQNLKEQLEELVATKLEGLNCKKLPKLSGYRTDDDQRLGLRLPWGMKLHTGSWRSGVHGSNV